MTKEELKNKYSTFITKISEILGLGKPIDVLKLCATTDLFFQPLKKRIEELEKENAGLKAGRPKWHKVADGDLPKTHGWYWVQYNNGTPDCLIVTKNLRFLGRHNEDVTNCIYAWKEIVLPKESE